MPLAVVNVGEIRMHVSWRTMDMTDVVDRLVRPGRWMRIWLWSAAALMLSCSLCLFAANAGQRKTGRSDTTGERPVTSDIRYVWVLGASLSASEGGPVAGSPEVFLYEIDCTGARLNSIERTQSDTHFALGSAAWTVELDQSPLSSEGAKALAIALDRVCRDSQ